MLQVILLLLPLGAPAPQRGTALTTRSPHGALNIPCQNCHTFSGWKPIRSVPEFDHSKTRYPLRGMHKSVACVECHTQPVFTNVGSKCADCHADIHRRQMGAQCESCHSVNGWMVSVNAIQQHDNRFPLLGAHAVTDCDSCHKNAAAGQFQGLSTDCVSCHMKQYLATTAPSHSALAFPTDCRECHTTMDTFAGAHFDHGTMTGFPLTGAHAALECTSCHVGGKYQGTPTNCISCHQADFNGASNPNHVQSGFPQTCAQCHTTTTWLGAKFDHAALTGFALTGAHSTLECTSCHVGGRYAGTPSNCIGCHQTDFNGTTNPNHVQAGFPQTCSTCHSTTTWLGAKFDHAAMTGFALTGAHATAACTQCHVNGRYAGTPKDCASCHLTSFQQTTNPNHTAVGFPTDCSICHSTTSWQGATFNHSTTGFTLTGMHATLACSACHTGGNLGAANTACVSCHLKDFNGATNPNHVTAGFPQQCNLCHSTSAWQPSTFNHSTTAFPLTGAHVTVACASCHVNGVYAGTPTDCYSCHKADYQNVTNPNHVAAGFPTTCATCHTTTSWAGATFNHTWFPIPHQTAKLCSDCHTNPSNYTVFVCTSCHTQAQTDPQHRGVSGYVWNSTNCYSCHRNGGGG